MKLHYDSETDSLYIDLIDRPSVESEEIADGFVLDFDADGQLVGIDVEFASKRVDLQRLVLQAFPAKVETEAA
jgi:uncharacterized protein YuzE